MATGRKRHLNGTTVVRPPISSSVSRPAETVSRIRGAGAPAWPTNRTRIVRHGAVEAGDAAILEGFGARRNTAPRRSAGSCCAYAKYNFALAKNSFPFEFVIGGRGVARVELLEERPAVALVEAGSGG